MPTKKTTTKKVVKKTPEPGKAKNMNDIMGGRSGSEPRLKDLKRLSMHLQGNEPARNQKPSPKKTTWDVYKPKKGGHGPTINMTNKKK